MKRQYPVLSARQAAFLREVHALGLCTDLSFCAAIVEAGGEPVDRSLIVRWRSGECPAPLGILPVLLDHVDDPSAVLDVLARPLGLRVVPEAVAEVDDRGLADRALELGDLLGDVQRQIRQALADGELTEDERAAIHASAEITARRASELAAVTAPGRRGTA